MTRLVMNGLKLRPYDGKPTKRSLQKGQEVKGYLIKNIFYDQFDNKIYLVKCLKCGDEGYRRFKHISKIAGCISCKHKENFKFLKKKIGDKVGTYTIIDIFRGEDEVARYRIRCDCGYEGTRYILRGLKCYRCNNFKKIGTRQGKLIFTKFIGHHKFEALCDCGNKCTVHRTSKSCGCLQYDRIKENAKRWIGYKWHNLKIIGVEKYPDGTYENPRTVYRVKCKCGNTIFGDTNTLFKKQKSCGCGINANYASGERSHNAKLTNKEAMMIRELHAAETYTLEEIKEIFNVGYHVVHDVLYNISYKDKK